jgi:capsid protein
VSQTRGVSVLNPICDIAGMFDDLNFATLIKAQVASCFAILREYSAASPPIPGGQGTMGSKSSEAMQDGTQRVLEGVAPAMIVDGKPGQKLTGFSPNIPNPEYFPHSTLLLTFMAMNLNLPLTVLLLDPERAGNFSALRGVLEQAKLGFSALQRWLIDKLHRPVWIWKARQWADEDRALLAALMKMGAAYFSCKWRPPRHPYIEPVTDRAAALLGSRNLLASPRDTAAENGAGWEDIVRESVEDNSLAIEAAIVKANDINARYPTAGVTWRDVLSLPTPDRVSVSLSATTAQTSNAPPPKKPTATGQGA